MPYVRNPDRSELTPRSDHHALAPGELNYQFTYLIQEYLRTHTVSYQAINDVLGALEGAKLEFYRRVAVPYEEVKRASNGDVYG